MCASLYSACSVTAKVGSGTEVKITEETGYPFSDTIRLRLSTPNAVNFPLYVRIPGWCDAPSIAINRRSVSAKVNRSSYAILHRHWEDGDTVELRLPMRLAVRKWPKN